jgi:hypothetical protein
MLLDTGHETLTAHRSRSFLIGLFLLASATTLTTAVQVINVAPGVAVLDDHAHQFGGRADLDCYTGTLAASSEVITDVVVYYLPTTDKAYLVAVQGTAALTSAGASAPTDADVEAAIPSTEGVKYARVGRVKFARDSGTVVTLEEIDHTVRPMGVNPDRKATTGDETDSVDGDAAVYVFSHRERHTIDAADIANGDGLTAKPCPAMYGKIGAWRAITEKAITTGAKGTTPNLEIGTTNVTGSDGVAMAGASALGVVLPLGAPTAANTFKPGDTWSIEFASTTTYIEGRFSFEVDFYRLVSSPVEA